MSITGSSVTWDFLSEAVQRTHAGPSGRYSTVYGVMDSYLLISHGENTHKTFNKKISEADILHE